MILAMVLLALSNGLLVIVSRILNARLGKEIGPAGASVWNHFMGTLLLVGIVFLFKGNAFHVQSIPLYAFLGGIIGAVYVTLSNFLIPKIGTSKATILMIAGQVGLATLIDTIRGIVLNPVLAILGVALILFGISIGENQHTKEVQDAALEIEREPVQEEDQS